MSEIVKRVLVSLWLLVTFPFNFVLLKGLIRLVFLFAADLDAGLGKHLWLQYLLATIFVLWVVVLLLRGWKLGRTLAVVLLLGSGCEIAGLALLLKAYTLFGSGTYAFWPSDEGLFVVAFIFAGNAVCLRSLLIRKATDLPTPAG